MKTDIRPEQSKSIPQGGEIQNGDTGNHQDIPATGGMGHLGRLQRCLLPYTDTGTVQEIPQISCPGPDLPIQSTAFWSVHSAHGIHCCSKGGKTDGHTQGYKDPPVPRRLVGKSQIPPNLSPTYPTASQDVPGSRLVGEYGKIRTGTQASLQLCQLPVRPQVRPGQTDTGPMAKSSTKDTSTFVTTGLSGPTVYVPDRSTNSHGKTSSSRPITHETHTVASQEQLEGTRIPREGHPSTQIPAPTFTMVARGKKHASRSTITPHKACSANIYRCIKRRVGRSLKRAHCKGILVGTRKQTAHKLSGTQSSFSSPQSVPRSLRRQNSSSSNRQYYSGRLHKQGRRHEFGSAMCPTLENLDLVFPAISDSKSSTHPRPFKCDSRQTIQAGSDHADGVVPPSRSLSTDMQPMAPASNRSIRHEVQPQVTSVCLSSADLPGCNSGCTYSAMGGSGCICLPTDRHIGQSGGEATGHPNMPWFWGLVTMSSQVPLSLPNLPDLLTQPFNQIPHRNLTNLNLHAWLLEPQQSKNRVSLRQWQRGLRLLREDQPDQSMRQSGPLLRSGVSLIRWTSDHHL